jgi:hypothetical protein
MLIPATFRPIPKTDRASLILSQLRSRIVVPPDTPNTPVWSAAVSPVWQTSLLLTTIPGLEAVGGVLSTTVELLTVADVTVSAE